MDGSNAHFYLDDLDIRTDRPVRQGPFVAPGRRMLFVDLWDYYRKQMYERPGCPPVLDHADFGLIPRDLQALSRVDALESLERLLDGHEVKSIPDQLDPYQRDLFDGLVDWQRGCQRDAHCDSTCAVELFDRAATAIPDAKLPPMCRVLALAGADRWAEADELFLSIYPDWQTDPRLPAISAVLGLARRDPDRAESAILSVPEELGDPEPSPPLQRLWSGQLDRQLVEDLKEVYGGRWLAHVEAALVAEHRYYVLLWQERHDEARRYAERMTRRYLAFGLAAGGWLERTADAAFHDGDHQAALEHYELALQETENPTAILLKLSDVYFKLGDVEMERAYRQRIYGTLEPKWTARDPVPNLDVDPCECP
jgi:tetratricopeptide (TPR) repeat protein